MIWRSVNCNQPARKDVYYTLHTMNVDSMDDLTTLGELSDMTVDRFFKNKKLLKFLTKKEKKSGQEPKQVKIAPLAELTQDNTEEWTK